MKNSLCFSFIFLMCCTMPCFGQLSAKYAKFVEAADSLYNKKEYLKSAETFGKAFASNDDKGMPGDRYNAACCWSLAGQKDSSFYHLFRLARKAGYSNLSHLVSDTDLNILHDDARWQELRDLVKKNKDEQEVGLEKPLVEILDKVHEEDQKYRVALDTIEKKYGWKSPEVKAQWEIIRKKDSLNTLIVTKILDERGWLGADVVGQQGNSTLFLVVQHADLQVQEKYLPMMREAVAQKKASASSLALLEDRVALRQGKKQIYGSQVSSKPKTEEYYVLPLDDPDNVDKRRASVGLGTLESYIRQWNIKWDVEAYKKALPELEALQKR